MSSATARTIAWLSSARKGIDLVSLFSPGRVELTLTPEVAEIPQAQMITMMATNLLVRLHPVVQVVQIILPPGTRAIAPMPRWEAGMLQEHLALMISAIKPEVAVHWGPGGPSCNVRLHVGPENTVPRTNTIYVGSDGWLSTISRSAACPIGMTNPIGAQVAACLGVAEIWKALLLPRREALALPHPIVPLKDSLSFLATTYACDTSGPNPPLPAAVQLDGLTIAGIGAGGSALIYSLASLMDLQGHLTLLDHDRIDRPNLNRYVIADDTDAQDARLKVELAESILSDRFRLTKVDIHRHRFQDIYSSMPIASLRRVVATVDHPQTRRDIQFETPQVLWGAGAGEEGSFRVSRGLFGKTECAYCEFPPSSDSAERGQAEALAATLGSTPDAWHKLILNDGIFAAEMVNELRSGKNEDIPYRLPQVGQAYRQWFAGQCGRLPLSAGAGTVPIPFAPVLAGVLLAGEVIKEFHFPELVLDGAYQNTALGAFHRRHGGQRMIPKEDCVCCSNQAIRDQHTHRWGEGTIK